MAEERTKAAWAPPAADEGWAAPCSRLRQTHPPLWGPEGDPQPSPCATVRTAQLPQGQDEGTPSPPPPRDVQGDGIKGMQLGEGGGGSAGWHTTTPCTHRVAVARGPQPLGTWGALEPTVLPQGCPWDSQRASDQRRTEMSPTGCLQGDR